MPAKRKLLAIAVLIAATGALGAPMRPAHGKQAMVASVHQLASQAGVQTMQQGGNAIDAAVAVGFALAVVHPQAGNLGGGGFLLLRFADGNVHFLDFREKAPAAATEKMYLDAAGNVIPELSTVGYKAIAVPGSVAGLAYAQQKWGKLRLKDVIAPAIRLAREGFPLAYEDTQDMRDRHLAEFPESRRIFQRAGRFFEQGEIFRQPELAATLERIAQNPGDFYKGDMARQIAAAVQKGGGLITEKDLASYEVKERQPVRGAYRRLEIISAPPPSSGGVGLIEILNILEGYDLAKLGPSAEAMHLITEAFRRAFFDRAEFMGDPDFAKIPVAQLIDKKYGLAWRESLDPQHASASAALRRPAAFNELERYATAVFPQTTGHRSIATRASTPPEPGHTTHYSVVDPAGNAVAVTTTLNDSFGSRVTVEGLGFLLNDEMDDFASKQGVPNAYGLIQGPANAIAAQKRPLSAMTPTIVLKDGKLFMVLGSPGGPRIISTVANVLINVVDFGMNIQEAVNAPRFHHQWQPDVLRYEKMFSADALKLLGAMGHHTEEGYLDSGERRYYWGDGECIAIDPKTGERLGASDARHNGKALGY